MFTTISLIAVASTVSQSGLRSEDVVHRRSKDIQCRFTSKRRDRSRRMSIQESLCLQTGASIMRDWLKLRTVVERIGLAACPYGQNEYDDDVGGNRGVQPGIASISLQFPG